MNQRNPRTRLPSLCVLCLLAGGYLVLPPAECQAARPSSRNVKSLSSQHEREQAKTRAREERPAPRPARTEAVAPAPVTETPPPAAAPAKEPRARPGTAIVMDGDQEVIIETVRGFTPSTQSIPPCGPAVEFWGIALVDASSFDRAGKRTPGKIRGGTLVEQLGCVQSSKGEMAKVKTWNGSAWTGPVLVSTADLVRFEGGRDDVDAEGVEDLRSYYGLASDLEARKAEIVRLAAEKNPYYADLKALVSTYNANEGEISRLTAERDAAKGVKRSRLADELRRLEVQIQREKAQIKEQTRKFESWKAEHGTAAPDFSADPLVLSIEGKMRAIKPRLASFGL